MIFHVFATGRTVRPGWRRRERQRQWPRPHRSWRRGVTASVDAFCVIIVCSRSCSFAGSSEFLKSSCLKCLFWNVPYSWFNLKEGAMRECLAWFEVHSPKIRDLNVFYELLQPLHDTTSFRRVRSHNPRPKAATPLPLRAAPPPPPMELGPNGHALRRTRKEQEQLRWKSTNRIGSLCRVLSAKVSLNARVAARLLLLLSLSLSLSLFFPISLYLLLFFVVVVSFFFLFLLVIIVMKRTMIAMPMVVMVRVLRFALLTNMILFENT